MEWEGEVKEGKVLGIKIPEIFDYLRTLKGKIRITAKRYYLTRSDKENRYLWGVPYRDIAEEIGESKEVVHELMKYKFLRREKIVNGVRMIIVGSTRNLSTIQFEEYAENIRRWGAEFLRINIQEPNQKDFL